MIDDLLEDFYHKSYNIGWSHGAYDSYDLDARDKARQAIKDKFNELTWLVAKQADKCMELELKLKVLQK